MSHVIDDATSTMNHAYDATISLDETVHISLELELIDYVEDDDISETDEIIVTENFETPDKSSSPRYELPVMPKGYVMDGEVATDFIACKDRDDLKKLLCKWKEKSLNARMKYDPKFGTSPIFVTNKDYEFSIIPELITLVESDPFHGYESETVVAHLTKLNDIATLFAHEEFF